MIKYWENFNANDDDIKQIIIDKFNYVTDLFIDLEDMDIVTYWMSPVYDDSGIDYRQRIINIDKFVNSQFKTLNNSSNLCITTYVKIPIEKSTDVSSTIFTKDGINILSSIMKTISRLESSGYDVKMIFGNVHIEYMPLEVLICFDI